MHCVGNTALLMLNLLVYTDSTYGNYQAITDKNLFTKYQLSFCHYREDVSTHTQNVCLNTHVMCSIRHLILNCLHKFVVPESILNCNKMNCCSSLSYHFHITLMSATFQTGSSLLPLGNICLGDQNMQQVISKIWFLQTRLMLSCYLFLSYFAMVPLWHGERQSWNWSDREFQ